LKGWPLWALRTACGAPCSSSDALRLTARVTSESSQNGTMEYQIAVNKALDYIEMNYPQKINLNDLACAAHVSPYHFHRIFRAQTGVSPKEYLDRIRVEKSLNRLNSVRGESITTVALDCGFSSSSRYAKVFRQIIGTSPRKFLNDSKKRQVYPSVLGYPDLLKNEIGEKDYPVSYHSEKERKILYLRVGGIHPIQIMGGWIRLMSLGGRKGLVSQNAERVALVWDNPDFLERSLVRYDVAFTLDSFPEDTGILSKRILPGGTYSRITFSGRARDMEIFFRWVYGVWLPLSGRELADAPAFRLYHSSPLEHVEGFFRFDFCLPLLN